MYRQSPLWLCFLAIPFALGGCDGSAELEMSELGPTEAGELATAALFATLNSTSVLPPRPGTEAQGLSEPVDSGAPWALDFEAEVRCPLGGTVVLAASLAAEGEDRDGALRAHYRLRQIHDGCSAVSLADGRLELSGAPRIEARAVVDRDGLGGVTWVGELSGSLHWRTGGRRGECAVALDFEAHGTEAHPDLVRMWGAACGNALEHETTAP